MNDVDKWCADQCGVEIDRADRQWRIAGGEWNQGYWIIKDPRCREIVREHFGIETEKSRGFYVGWVCYVREGYFDESKIKLPNAYAGKIISEAEIACITAIYEASQ